MWKIRIGLFAAAVVAVAGCSKPYAASRVTGTVTYKGQPLKAGTLVFAFDQGGRYQTVIRSDGKYEISDLPSGPARVLVDTEAYNPDKKAPVYGRSAANEAARDKQYAEYDRQSGKSSAPADNLQGVSPELKQELSKLYVKIPLRYGNEKTTSLTYTVQPGEQTKDFELTD